jgi:hypothetical protein
VCFLRRDEFFRKLFSDTESSAKSDAPLGAALAPSLNNLRKNSMLHLILGGAAVYRCDNRRIFSIGFSR